MRRRASPAWPRTSRPAGRQPAPRPRARAAAAAAARRAGTTRRPRPGGRAPGCARWRGRRRPRAAGRPGTAPGSAPPAPRSAQRVPARQAAPRHEVGQERVARRLERNGQHAEQAGHGEQPAVGRRAARRSPAAEGQQQGRPAQVARHHQAPAIHPVHQGPEERPQQVGRGGERHRGPHRERAPGHAPGEPGHAGQEQRVARGRDELRDPQQPERSACGADAGSPGALTARCAGGGGRGPRVELPRPRAPASRRRASRRACRCACGAPWPPGGTSRNEAQLVLPGPVRCCRAARWWGWPRCAASVSCANGTSSSLIRCSTARSSSSMAARPALHARPAARRRTQAAVPPAHGGRAQRLEGRLGAWQRDARAP